MIGVLLVNQILLGLVAVRRVKNSMAKRKGQAGKV